MDELITFTEAMQILKVSRATLNRWINSGKITKLKLGEGRRGMVRFRKEDIEKFITDSVTQGRNTE
jgi:excisionase family DNA binding protein